MIAVRPGMRDILVTVVSMIEFDGVAGISITEGSISPYAGKRSCAWMCTRREELHIIYHDFSLLKSVGLSAHHLPNHVVLHLACKIFFGFLQDVMGHKPF